MINFFGNCIPDDSIGVAIDPSKTHDLVIRHPVINVKGHVHFDLSYSHAQRIRYRLKVGLKLTFFDRVDRFNFRLSFNSRFKEVKVGSKIGIVDGTSIPDPSANIPRAQINVTKTRMQGII